MTYHIKQIDNQSDRSVALTNPKTGTSKRDCVLILPAPSQKQPYVPEHPPEVNKIEGNPSYAKAAATALNIYTKADNYCFWDNTDSAANWLGEAPNSTIQSYNASGGDLKLIISSSGTISFVRL